MALAALWLMFAQGFWMLMIGQVGLILSRAAFWPATWAMASELPGDRGVQLGLLNAVTNAGQIGGTVLCGLLLSAAGFGPTFAVLALVSVAAYVAGLGTSPTPPKPAAGQRHVLAPYLPLLRNRIVHYSILCAYLSALPFSLSLSFYPLLLAQFGYSEDASGVLLALRAIGAIAAGLIAGRFVRTGPETLWPVVCGVSVAVGVGLLPVTNHVVPIGFWLFIVGLGSGAMTLYFQITIAEASETGARGSALALGGLGWSISHLTTPLLMGFLADRYSIVVAFYVVGAMALVTAVLIAWMRRWAFRKPAGVRPP
jgi:predicted MFS family arabinose efflux permease